MYLPLWSSRLLRSRYSFIVCLLVALMLLTANLNFLFYRAKNLSRDPTRTLNEQHEAFQLANQTLNITLNQSIINIDITNQTTAVHLPENHFRNKFEPSGCEIMLSGTHWTTWNIADLCFSSAGPFAFLVILNILIILRVCRPRAQNSPHKSTSARLCRRATSTNGASVFPIIGTHRINTAPSVSFRRSNSTSNRIRKLNAERSVTLMLLVSTFAFLIMRAPISVGHLIQTLLTEEKLFEFIEPVTCMGVLKTLPEEKNHHMHVNRITSHDGY